MKKLLIATVAAISLTACATGPRQPSQSEMDVRSSRSSYMAALSGIERFLNTDPIDCSSSSMLGANRSISNIETHASSWIHISSATPQLM